MKIAIISSFPPKRCGVGYPANNLFLEFEKQGHELVRFGMDDSKCDFTLNISSIKGLLEAAVIIKSQGIKYVSIQYIIGLYNKRFIGFNFLLFLFAF